MAITTSNTTTNAQQGFDIRTIDRFSYRLRYNIEVYLQLYSHFIQNNVQSIVQFFEDSINNPNKESFDFLESMMIESAKIKILIKLNKNSFRQIDDWELLDFLENIDTKLQTINNAARWTRSSRTQNSWSGNVIQTNYVLRDDQTLEQVSEDVYGGNTSQDDWMRIAVENDLGETDYQVRGGNQIKITKRNSSSPNYFLNSIIDNLVGQKLYGIDFNRKIGFTNNDLNVLSYNDTVIQSVLILVSVKKGDNPEFSALGVDPKLAIGASYGSLKFSSIIRQLQQVFATDDSLRNFSVTNVSYQNGVLSISYKVDTFYNLTYNSTTNIQQQ
jgi:hypothetical protein